mmetsp:Transcript_35480/g.56757  ORF Transcript_35480/g.56757 Transcript_35480/m.56757 type:complete len:253 (-) Transcript_35480:1012-1770(-)
MKNELHLCSGKSFVGWALDAAWYTCSLSFSSFSTPGPFMHVFTDTTISSQLQEKSKLVAWRAFTPSNGANISNPTKQFPGPPPTLITFKLLSTSPGRNTCPKAGFSGTFKSIADSARNLVSILLSNLSNVYGREACATTCSSTSPICILRKKANIAFSASRESSGGSHPLASLMRFHISTAPNAATLHNVKEAPVSLSSLIQFTTTFARSSRSSRSLTFFPCLAWRFFSVPNFFHFFMVVKVKCPQICQRVA